MEQGGDIFFANLMPPPGQNVVDMGTMIPLGQNYLWFEEGAIGLEWTVPSPAPYHTFEEPPDIDESMVVHADEISH